MLFKILNKCTKKDTPIMRIVYPNIFNRKCGVRSTNSNALQTPLHTSIQASAVFRARVWHIELRSQRGVGSEDLISPAAC
jgi:hypothetical protein